MNVTQNQGVPAPPSLITAFQAGFEAIANHLGLILFPVALDLILWWGPRLRLLRLFEQAINQLATLPGAGIQGTLETAQLTRDDWYAAIERLNLISFLRSFPVGIPSLMTSDQTLQTPFGNPPIWEAPSVWAVFALFLLLTLFGLALGTFFFLVVSQASLTGSVRWRAAIDRWPWTTLQVILLELLWFVLLIGISLPASCLITAVTMSGIAISQFIILLFGGLLIWMLFPLFFSAHGIFVNQNKMWESVQESVRLTRFTLPKSGLLILSVVLISEGLNILWRIPAEASWLKLVGVAGHAMVTTSLLAATFIYYRDAQRWVQWLLRQAKLTMLTSNS